MLKELKKELLKALSNLKSEKFEKYTNDQLNISDRVVGGKVEIINSDKTLTVAPDGDYELEDGFKFTVKDGVIASIEGEEPKEEDFEDVSALAIGDEVTINPDAKEYLPWFAGANFVVSSIDGYGEGCVGLSNDKGFYVTYTKSISVTKTGNKIELPKDENFADESQSTEEKPDESKTALENLQKETDALKAEVESLKQLIAELTGNVNDSASKEEMQKFSTEVKTLTETINKVAKIPVEFSKTTKSTQTRTDNHDKLMNVIKLIKK